MRRRVRELTVAGSAHSSRRTGSVKVNVEPRPDLALHPDPPAVELDELPGEGEPEARALDLLVAPSPPAGTPRTPPPDPRARCRPRCPLTATSAAPSCTRRRRRSGRPPGVNFERVGQQVQEHLLDLALVASNRAQRARRPCAPRAIPRRVARSRTRVRALSMAAGQVEVGQPPAPSGPPRSWRDRGCR